MHYSADTGVFTWKHDVNNRTRVGSVAGTLSDTGCIVITVKGRPYKAHRLAWLYMTGEWPDITDHINHNRTDNRFSNLRNGTVSNNMENQVKPRKGSKTGFMGVTARGIKWRAKIMVRGKHICVGTYPSAEEAHNAYVLAKRKLHEFNTL